MAFFKPKSALKTIAPLETAGEVFAVLQTNLGQMRARLFVADAPQTVTNFVQLAEGTVAWKGPWSGKDEQRPFYDGLGFHRIVSGFVIQGGCPKGDGTGGPGWQFADECKPNRRHDKAGVLSMANAGPNTNGSQFFITCAATPELDGKHTVFGELESGHDVLTQIASSQVDGNEKPRTPVVIQSVRIERA